MFNYLALVIIFGLVAIITSTKSQSWQLNLKNRRNVCIFLCLLFIIQADFRDYQHQMNDTLRYAEGFDNLKYESFSNLIKSAIFIAHDYEERDPGYSIFVKLVQIVISDFQLYLVLVACIISIPICRIFYKYCTSIPGIFIAASLYEALFAHFFETGIRQTIAMGLSFIALELYQKNRYIWCASFTFFAYTIHTTSLMFIPIYFLLRIKNQNKMLGAAILMAPIFALYAKNLLAAMGEGTIMESYTSLLTEDNAGTPVFTAMIVLGVLIIKYYAERIEQNNQNYQLMFTMMSLAIMLTPATWVNTNFIRVALYYLIFLMPLQSIVIESMANMNRKLMTNYYIILAVALMVLTYNQK